MSRDVVGKPDRRAAWIARGGSWLLRLLGWTWRIEEIDGEGWRDVRRSGKPVIFALWHGQLLPLLYKHRREGVVIMISEHGDGELVARIAERLGYGTVRGSTSRGAARALLESARTVEQGHDLAITPDGPRGPAKSIAAGALVIAQRSRAPIIPIGVVAPKAWHAKSWDSFMIPRPFARVRVAYGPPVYVTRGDARAATEDASRLRDLMTAAEERARA